MEFSSEIKKQFIEYYWGEKDPTYDKVIKKINEAKISNTLFTKEDIKNLYSELSKTDIPKIKSQWSSICSRDEEAKNWKFSDFYFWYIEKEKLGCHYCGLSKDVIGKFLNYQHAKGGHKRTNRGSSFEVDRKNHKSKYQESDCVLVCYICNNAKSDFYEYDEFLEIGKTIGIEIRKIIDQI